MNIIQFKLGKISHVGGSTKIINNGERLAIRADMIHSFTTDSGAEGGCVLVPMNMDNSQQGEAYYYITDPYDFCVSKWLEAIAESIPGVVYGGSFKVSPTAGGE